MHIHIHIYIYIYILYTDFFALTFSRHELTGKVSVFSQLFLIASLSSRLLCVSRKRLTRGYTHIVYVYYVEEIVQCPSSCTDIYIDIFIHYTYRVTIVKFFFFSYCCLRAIKLYIALYIYIVSFRDSIVGEWQFRRLARRTVPYSV